MKLSTKVAELTQIIEPAVTACDVSLWGIEFVPQGRRSLLRIYIEALPEDRAEGKQVLLKTVLRSPTKSVVCWTCTTRLQASIYLRCLHPVWTARFFLLSSCMTMWGKPSAYD